MLFDSHKAENKNAVIKPSFITASTIHRLCLSWRMIVKKSKKLGLVINDRSVFPCLTSYLTKQPESTKGSDSGGSFTLHAWLSLRQGERDHGCTVREFSENTHTLLALNLLVQGHACVDSAELSTSEYFWLRGKAPVCVSG